MPQAYEGKSAVVYCSLYVTSKTLFSFPPTVSQKTVNLNLQLVNKLSHLDSHRCRTPHKYNSSTAFVFPFENDCDCDRNPCESLGNASFFFSPDIQFFVKLRYFIAVKSNTRIVRQLRNSMITIERTAVMLVISAVTNEGLNGI